MLYRVGVLHRQGLHWAGETIGKIKGRVGAKWMLMREDMLHKGLGEDC